MSFWGDVDTYLETQAMLNMGPSGSYATLQIKVARIDDYWQEDKVLKENLFPFSLFRGYEMTVPDPTDGFGDGEAHTVNSYMYWWVSASKTTTRRAAKQDAQELMSRMRKFLRQRPVLNGLTPTADWHGERMGNITLGPGWIQQIGRLDQETGDHYGIAILRFTIETNN